MAVFFSFVNAIKKKKKTIKKVKNKPNIEKEKKKRKNVKIQHKILWH